MWGRTATEHAAGIRARELSAREVMQSQLERIAAVKPRVNAIVTLLDPELALRAAAEADSGEVRGRPARTADRRQGPRGHGRDAHDLR